MPENAPENTSCDDSNHLVVIFINDGEYTLYTYMWILRMIPHIIMIVMIMEMTIFHNKGEKEDDRW